MSFKEYLTEFGQFRKKFDPKIREDIISKIEGILDDELSAEHYPAADVGGRDQTYVEGKDIASNRIFDEIISLVIKNLE